MGLRKLHGLIHTIHDVDVNVNPFEKIIDTRQFGRFFKGSKAVDANGKPLVLYAAANTAQATDPGDAVSGIRLTMERQDGNGGQEAVYASIRYPLRLANRDALQRYLKRDTQYRQLMAEGKTQQARDRAAAFLRSRSFDGVHLLNDGSGAEIWIAFANNQVKSATDNVGTYDPRVDDWRYSRQVQDQGNRPR